MGTSDAASGLFKRKKAGDRGKKTKTTTAKKSVPIRRVPPTNPKKKTLLPRRTRQEKSATSPATSQQPMTPPSQQQPLGPPQQQQQQPMTPPLEETKNSNKKVSRSKGKKILKAVTRAFKKPRKGKSLFKENTQKGAGTRKASLNLGAGAA